MTDPLYAVLPGDIDDPAAPSGGNTYDRRILTGLAATRAVHEIAVAAPWPYPSEDDQARLAGELHGLPDGATVLMDGLVACAAPRVVEEQAVRLRLVVLVHLPLGDEPGAAPDLPARERRTVHAAHAVVATSAGAARRVEQLHALPVGSVHVAPPGVDPAPETAGSPAGGRLLCVASVTPRKAQDVLVEALHTLDDLDWTCVCVGSLDDDRDFAARVQARAGDRVRFPGTRGGAALAASYAEADLLVLPSRAETYGMVVTEALARGIPVLATQVEGVPEAMGKAGDGTVPGGLVPPGDVQSLAGALRRWLTDEGLRRDWRAAARARRGTLRGWDHTIRRLSEVLHP
ncbi:glycosyltransferase family 4 protein [Couchioplanes caeruleus]|uniref:Glycosyl transferase n=2 Tax=Couchioplanes caeruleus TaxID=56438 RepID=A0A1K0FFA1_9ACTN|nr:glycosyltransferase family 4 protein [Couchioplanes caeruleus]OJF11513.1 glycosyl transferase [Couchioplanes caeruleus subsp. caeruleus]ROP27740.1 glycosyl transferase family 1 [Couchioplanes caeruleus]